VNLDKLAKQLRRDVAANPKKAAVLGLMALVALYFWGPLVWGWVNSGDGKNKAKAELANLILTDDPLEPADKAKARSKPKFHWEKVRPLLAQDPRMVSATFDEVWIDPFGKPAHGEGEDARALDATNSSAAAVAAQNNPPDHGLTLTSVAIGPRRSAATISGERYYVGDEIAAGGKDKALPGLIFRVTKITPQGVELQGHGRIIVLQLSRSRLASGDTIARTPGSGARQSEDD
jgi:hypothetical protein